MKCEGENQMGCDVMRVRIHTEKSWIYYLSHGIKSSSGFVRTSTLVAWNASSIIRIIAIEVMIKIKGIIKQTNKQTKKQTNKKTNKQNKLNGISLELH